MILVDSSVWVDHLRRRDAELVALLDAGVVMCHPFVIGELACGSLSNRAAFLAELANLPAAPVASHDEALGFVDRHALTGCGIGWVDAHLLASAYLAGRVPLLTRDKRLRAIAGELGIAAQRERH
ncbi:MAG: type II toxin-antitoxin system VapC family toxin [Proteobacteria bacterium]|nr:type II toxin-antitoxin system VapC family toxin [Pseudomonadota bacterium]